VAGHVHRVEALGGGHVEGQAANGNGVHGVDAQARSHNDLIHKPAGAAVL